MRKHKILFLYLPPHTCHLPGILSRTITGMILRIFCLTSNCNDCHVSICNFFWRLCLRGYSPQTLHPLFSQHTACTTQSSTCIDQPIDPQLFFYLPFRLLNPSSFRIQFAFKEHILKPTGKPELPSIKNSMGQPFGILCMIIANHHLQKIGNYVGPQCFKKYAAPVSTFIHDNT